MTRVRIEVKPELLRWACQRSGKPVDAIMERFPQFNAWISQEEKPTLKQAEAFAKATYTPIGFLFLNEPPVETIPIPDFRTIGNKPIPRPSPDLLDTIYVCQQRQDWYRDHARTLGESSLPFVGSTQAGSDIVQTAATIRKALGLDLEERRQLRTFEEALRALIAQADALGVLVMCSGVVFSNNKRKLDRDEFRGFAMSDTLAPLIFINGSDSKSAQMFTLTHELAHIWAGASAVSNAQASSATGNSVERWCNQVAAEVLVPLADFKQQYQRQNTAAAELERLARRYKVSSLVILRRMHDAGGLTDDELWRAYHAELKKLETLKKTSGGGDFYLTTAARVSKRFARALVASTLEGQTMYREAFRMLGFSKLATFHELGRGLGVIV